MTTSPDILEDRASASASVSTSSFTQEWIDRTNLQRASKLLNHDSADESLAQELLDSCLDVSFAVWPKIKLSNTFEEHQLHALKEVLGSLHLFSVGFQDGKLAYALSQSDELRDSVLEVVADISQSILNNFVPTNFLEDSKDLENQVTELGFLLRRSKLLISNYGGDGDFNGDGLGLSLAITSVNQENEASNEKANPYHSLIQDLKARVNGGSISTTSQDRENLAFKDVHKGGIQLSVDSEISIQITGDSESEGGDTSSTESSSDVYSFLRCRTECLLDLVPTIERNLVHAEKIITKLPATKISFSMSEAARPFVLRIADKFIDANIKLVERLGEANWQRFVQIRDRIGETSDHNHTIDPVQEMHCKDVPQSLSTPRTLFHDSGIGTSVAPGTRYAASVASHTSFISSNAEGDYGSLRVPATPAEVFEGKPFRCFICNSILSSIRTRVDWKLHVFSDLKPYICTVESCPSELTQFPTRKLWETHEFNEHRVCRSWRCPFCPKFFGRPKDLERHLPSKHDYLMTTIQLHQFIKSAEIKTPSPIESQVCPLCGVIPGKSQRNFATHVGRHMENIALVVLPTATKDESDEDSIDTGSDHRSSVSFGNFEVRGIRGRSNSSMVGKDSTTAAPPVKKLDSLTEALLNDPWPSNVENLPQIISDAGDEKSFPWSPSMIPGISSLASPYFHSTTYRPYPQTAEARRLSINSSHSRYSQDSPHSVSIGFEEERKKRGRCPNPDCNRLFNDLKAHMLTHQPERPEKCPITTCDYHKKGFARKYDKQRHVLTHYKGTMVCGFCSGSGSVAGKSFNRADVFKRHLIRVHGVEQSPPNARKRSPTASAKRVTSQSNDTTTGKCSTCGITFNNAQDFYEHLDECVLDVVRVVRQGDKDEAINERFLATVANHTVQETLAHNMLPLGLEDGGKREGLFVENEDEDDAQAGSTDEGWAGPTKELPIPSNRSDSILFTPKQYLAHSSKTKIKDVYQLFDDEAYVMKAFAHHASHCKTCDKPFEVFKHGGTLCPRGHQRARDVAEYVCSRGGKIYSLLESEDGLQRQLEIPAELGSVRSLLIAMEHGLQIMRSAPPMSYESEQRTVVREGQELVHEDKVGDILDDMVNSVPTRRRENLPKQVIDRLRNWFQERLGHPDPTEEEKKILMAQTGLTMTQIIDWFIRENSPPETWDYERQQDERSISTTSNYWSVPEQTDFKELLAVLEAVENHFYLSIEKGGNEFERIVKEADEKIKSRGTYNREPYPSSFGAPHLYVPGTQSNDLPTNERSSTGWTREDDLQLMKARSENQNWGPIASKYYPTTTPNECRRRHERLMEERQSENWNGLKLDSLAKAESRRVFASAENSVTEHFREESDEKVRVWIDLQGSHRIIRDLSLILNEEESTVESYKLARAQHIEQPSYDSEHDRVGYLSFEASGDSKPKRLIKIQPKKIPTSNNSNRPSWTQIGRGCDRCRQRNTKCDPLIPCNPCQLSGQQCSHSVALNRLRDWLQEHIANPYPTEEEKQILMAQTGLTMIQISDWFINARQRNLPQITTQAKWNANIHDHQGPPPVVVEEEQSKERDILGRTSVRTSSHSIDDLSNLSTIGESNFDVTAYQNLLPKNGWSRY